MPIWAQSYDNGHRYYGEQCDARGAGHCVGRIGSMPCHVLDDQMGKIVSAIVLSEAWMDRDQAPVHPADEVNRVELERKKTGQRLKRLGRAYVDGLYPEENYRREKHCLEDRLASLVVQAPNAGREAGKLLVDLPALRKEANVSVRRRKLLLSMLDAVYVHTIEEKSVVAITPRRAFRPSSK